MSDSATSPRGPLKLTLKIGGSSVTKTVQAEEESGSEVTDLTESRKASGTTETTEGQDVQSSSVKSEKIDFELLEKAIKVADPKVYRTVAKELGKI